MTHENYRVSETVIESLKFRLRTCPDKVAYRYLPDGENEGASLTYRELYNVSENVARNLSSVAAPGERALLLYPQGLDFVTALFGCFMAGVIAVPVFPPSGRRRMERLENVVKDCKPTLTLATTSICNQAKSWFAERNIDAGVQWLGTDELPTAPEKDLPKPNPEDVALLQYTSGSTGDPKGVEVTHDNLVHNNHALFKASGGQTNTVCWLPIYHDMGLIGNLIYVANCGGTLTLMSPVDFIRKPVRWFWAMSKFEAQASGSPNFGYDLCYRQITDSELEGIDLSHLKATVNGAEPIKPATVEKFARRFASIGFQKDAFTPCYGMAEATALISGQKGAIRDLTVDAAALGRKKVVPVEDSDKIKKVKILACSGPPADGMRIEIVDPNTRMKCPPDAVGEIWVQGRSVARGYWNRKDLSREVFSAEMLDHENKTLSEYGKFLRTGDMGFVNGGMLYITGRIKEMFVINGANIYPQDIERSIQEDNPILQENAGAVFSVENDEGADRIVVFQEIARTELKSLDAEEVIKDISQRVLARHELFISGVYLLSPGQLPKTTSGKIQRLKCAELYASKKVTENLGHWDIGPFNHRNEKMENDSLKSRMYEEPVFLNMLEALKFYNARQPQKIAYRFLEGGEVPGPTLTYGQLYSASRKLAAVISEYARPGDRAMLVFPSGLDFPVAFFACMMSGVIAVPMYVPSGKRRLERFEIVSRDCNPVLAIGESGSSAKAKLWFSENAALDNLKWIDADQVGEVSDRTLPDIAPDDIAFLQYTSGSTGNPKGVQVTHKNLVHNTWLIYCASGYTENIVSWLPIYHDMGLIGNILFSIYSGSTLTLMSPVDFIKRPSRWLRALSNYNAGSSAAPNFAYDLCNKYITDEEIEGIDLSNWQVACNGAEPIKAATIKQFSRRFAGVGFSADTFLPCYGMAETTLIVSGTRGVIKTISVDEKAMLEGEIKMATDPEAARVRELVSSGPVLKDMQVMIVHPETNRVCPPGVIGEIRVKGSSVAKGYWQKEEVNKEVFESLVLDENGTPLTAEGAYLRTGDLGFLDEGLLYVTGRLKELIIINGANIYPQDVERTIQESSEYLQDNAGAVFSVEAAQGPDKIVVMQEVARQHVRDFDSEALFETIGNQIIANHELAVAAIFLISPGQLPKTTSGKIQRVKCKQLYIAGEVPGVLASSEIKEKLPEASKPAEDSQTAPKKTAEKQNAKLLERWLVGEISRLLEIERGMVKADASFANLGMSSIQGIQLSESLSRHLGMRVEPTDLYNYSTIERLVNQLFGSGSEKSEEPKLKVNQTSDRVDEPVAIVGMSCRFPGAENVDAFWHLLVNGKDGITEVPDDRWNLKEYYSETQTPGKMVTKWGGFIDDVDRFDAPFFEISPREAALMDPQQRVLLQETYKLFESAGYSAHSLRGAPVGVFIGISGSDYAGMMLKGVEDRNIYTATGTSYSIAANRLSYFFDLRGPSVSIDTACSSSLTAFSQAVDAVKSGDCTMAVAGGVNMILSPEGTLSFSESGLMAPDGRCKTFDADANGIVRSDGCGVLLLKSLSKALEDGDHIHALVRGTAVNQDGRSNGLTAPNGLAQEACVRKALSNAGLKSNEVSFVETHGTGTILGDPIEVNALHAAYGEGRKAPLLVGSVKANIGHLEAAAGAAGLIKTVLSLAHREVPRQIHFHTPNPQIDWANVKVSVAKDGYKFKEEDIRLRAGVSSFGFGGTNAHVILEEAPKTARAVEKAGRARDFQIFPVSAKDDKALKRKLTEIDRVLERNPQLDLSDAAYTLSTGRDHFSKRAVAFGKNAEEVRKGIAALLAGEESLYSYEGIKTKGVTAFFFTGAGSQYPGMGKHLYDTEPAFRTGMDECAKYANHFLEKGLLEVIFSSPGSELHKLLDRIDYMQPAVFAFEYSMYRWWESLGINPDIVIGHSLGELVAACVAGVFDLESGMKLVVKRGELIYKMPVPGTMASVQASEEEVNAVIKNRNDVSVAVINSMSQTVVSGEVEGVEAIVAHFDAQGRKTKVLNISRAGHSPLMDAISEDFRKVAESFEMKPAAIPVISNVTGKIAGDEIATSKYWVDHLRQPVRFRDGLETVAEFGADILIEAGPGPVLLGISKGANLPGGDVVRIPSAAEEDKDRSILTTSVARYYAAGGRPDWKAFFADRPGGHINLPTYPFAESRYWMEASVKKAAAGEPTGQPLIEQALKVAGLEGVFELEVSRETVPYLGDHRIIDAVIAPGSFHVELILEYLAFAKKNFILRELSIQRPLFVDESARRKVQLKIEKQELSESLEANIYSTDASGTDWTLHVSGTLQKRKSESAVQNIDVEAVKAIHSEVIDIQKFYSGLAEIGFHYGSSFQGVRELRTGDRSAFAELAINLSSDEAAEADKYQLHPTILDAAFQLLAAVSMSGDSKDTYLPFAIENLELAVPGLTKCLAELKVADVAEGSDIMSCEIALYTMSGAFAGRLDFSCKKASPEQIVADGSRLRTDWMYDARWIEYKSDTAEVRPENMLLLCHDDIAEDYEGFLMEIKNRGIPHTVVSDWGQAAAMMFNTDYDALAVLWSSEHGERSIAEQAREKALEGLKMLQDIIAAAAGKGPKFMRRVFWITEGYATGGIDLRSAPLRGLGCTFARETNFDIKLIDIDRSTFDTEALPDAMFKSGSENQLRLKNRKTEVLRLTRHKAANAEPRRLTADATWVITGGLGDLGLQAARWISENTDIAALELWARRAPSTEAEAAIAEIEASGTKVTVRSVDVSNAKAVREAIASASSADLPLKGVLHIAGVAEDALIPEQNEEKFDKVLNPKVRGAWNLHEATIDINLEVFELYSSLSALAGVPGVSNYAAANSFLDALAHHRRELGLQGHSINWGAWASATGLLDESRVDDFRKYMRARGLDLIEGNAGVDILGYFLKNTSAGSQTFVAPLILSSPSPFELPSGELQPLYRDLFEAAGEEEAAAKSNLRREMYLADPEDRHAMLASAIKRQVGLVIRHDDPESIDADADLFSLGVDSLMAAEMVSRLSKMIKEPLAPTILFDQRTINDLTGFLLEVTIDFSEDEDGGGRFEESDDHVTTTSPRETTKPAEDKGSRPQEGNAAEEAWDVLLSRILAKELESRGKDPAALQESRSLRRQLSKLASLLNKKA